jgi:hypothetical protein
VCWRGALTPATSTLVSGCSKLLVERSASRSTASRGVGPVGDVDELIRRGDVSDKQAAD